MREVFVAKTCNSNPDTQVVLIPNKRSNCVGKSRWRILPSTNPTQAPAARFLAAVFIFFDLQKFLIRRNIISQCLKYVEKQKISCQHDWRDTRVKYQNDKGPQRYSRVISSPGLMYSGRMLFTQVFVNKLQFISITNNDIRSATLTAFGFSVNNT